MRFRCIVEKPSTHLHEGASHVDVMVRKVKEKLLQAEQALGFRKHVKLDQLADEPAHLQLGLDLHLVLFPHLPSEFLLQILSQISRNVWDEGMKRGNESSVKG